MQISTLKYSYERNDKNFSTLYKFEMSLGSKFHNHVFLFLNVSLVTKELKLLQTG